ncbi:polymorphic toxin-type HINT domain-containing protein [Nonomuraea zeae]|nr:polymorphic toxin-type HINT domain-containing protein [Nonomuraea zeae]
MVDTPSIGTSYPESGTQVDTLTPQLRVEAYNTGLSNWWDIEREYKVCEASTCTTSPWKPWTDPYWTVPVGKLQWGKSYTWEIRVRDITTGGTSVRTGMYFTTGVRQPQVSSLLATSGVNGQEFHQVPGNYTATVTDASIATAGSVPLAVMRSYNSLDRRAKTMFGAGWSTRFDMKIAPEGGTSESLLLTYPDGRQLRFVQHVGKSTYQPPPGMHFTLTKQTAGGWKLMDKQSTVYEFDTQGRLLNVADSRGRGQQLTYTEGKLTKVTADGGRSLSFSFTGDHVTAVSTDPVGGTPLTWTYHYDGDRLAKVCAPGQESSCTAYTYDSASRYRETVLDSRPVHYFRLGEVRTETWPEVGTVTCFPDEADAVGCQTFGSGTVTGQPGALAGTTNAAATFQGSGRSSHFEIGPTLTKLGDQLSVEAWFKTTKSGFIYWAGKGAWNASSPGYGVPGLYVGTDGKLRGLLKLALGAETPGTPVASPQAVNDGQWHHAVITVANENTALYVDGAAAGSEPVGVEDWDWVSGSVIGTGAADSYLPGTPAGISTPAEFGFQGSIDEVALYDRALTAAEVRAHYDARAEAAFSLSKVTLPSGRTWMSGAYDPASGRLTSMTDDNGGTWKIGVPVLDHDKRISTASVTDPRQKTLQFEYDPWRGHRLVSATDQLGKKTTYSYDTGGFLQTVTDPNSTSITDYSDARGNVVQRKTCRTTSSCQYTHYSYYYNATNVFDARNNLLTTFRDARSASSTDNTYATVWEYNTYGEQTKETAPATPDFPQGRSLTIAYTDGTEAAIGGGTTPAGLVKTRTDARGNVWEQRYTAAGDLAEQTEPEGLITTYDYDAVGRAVARTEISTAFPDGVKTSLAYDGLGQLVRHTGAPVKNEITGKTHTIETRHTYDPDGNTLTDTVADLTGGDPERTITYTYDAFGREETVTGPEGGVVRASWDTSGARTTVTDELGSVFGYTYTERGEPATRTLKNWTGSPVNPQPSQEIVLESYSYDPGGRLAAQVDAMGRKTSYTYFTDDLLADVIAKDVKVNDLTTVKDIVLESNTYDAAGNRAGVKTPAAQTTFAYDAAGRLASSTFDPAGLARKVTNAYDANDNLLKQTLTAAGTSRAESVEFGYNKENQLVRQTVENGETDLTTTWSVDQRGLVTASVDPRGNLSGATAADFTTHHRYDAHGRLVEAKAPTVTVERAGTAESTRPTTRFGYDSAGRQTHVIDAEGRQSTTAFDKLGRVTAVTGTPYTPPGGTPLVPQQSFAYDAAGQLTKVTDARGNSSTAEYDALGNQVRTTQPAIDGQPGGQEVTEYDLAGEPLAQVDPTGGRIEATYDDLGRMITRTLIERRPAMAAYTTKFSYTNAGFPDTMTPPIGKATSYGVNAAGEITKITDPLGYLTEIAYDAAGRTAKTTTPLRYASVLEYDLAGRLIASKDLDTAGAMKRMVEHGYDAASNPVRTTSGEGHVTTRSYDATNVQTQLVEPVSATESITTTFGYDATRAPTRSTDGRGNTVWTGYNTLGLVETVTEPSTAAHPAPADRTWTQSYDAAGNLTVLQQPGGVRIDRHYDALNRLTKETGQGAQVATPERGYRYDATGRQVGIGDYSLEYNDRGLLTKVTRGATQIALAAFTYDALGNPLTRSDSSGNATFTWDDNTRLATAADPVSGRAFTYGYDKDSRLTSLNSTSPVNTQVFTYDPLSRVETHTLKSATAQLAKITYGWDKDDHLISKTTEGTAGAGGNTYGYDRAGRLTSWTAPNGNVTSYTWDGAGNRTKAGEATYTYDERNRLLSGAGTDYTYTPRGTLATETTGTATKNLVFDAFDRLVNDGEATYAYDALGRLTTRKKGTEESRFTYSGLANDITTVSDQTGTTKAKYGRDPSGGILSLQEGGDPALGVMSDLHSDVVATFSGTALVDSVAYNPFGEPIARTGAQRSLGYQGEYTDPDTGKVNMDARWYVPGTGGFASRDDWTLSPDPSSQLNRYLYGQGDPLAHQDPNGHSPHINVNMNVPRPEPGFKKGWSQNWCNGGGGPTCAQAEKFEAAGKTEAEFYDRVHAPAAQHYNKADKQNSDTWTGSGDPGKKHKQGNRPTGKKRTQGQSSSGTKKDDKKRTKKRRDRSDDDDDEQARSLDSDRRDDRRCTRNCPQPKKPAAKKRTPTKPKKAVKGSVKSSAKGGTPKKRQTKKSTDEKCRTGPCTGTYSGIELGRGSVATASDYGVSDWKKDIVEDLAETTTDSIIDEILDDVAPDLPPSNPPGLNGCTPSGNSFVPGTRVLMADGSHQPIEDVKVGDRVIATDPVTGITAAKPVTTLITGDGTKHLVKITVDVDGARGGTTDDITATDNHPFWVPALREWVDAGQLQPGIWLQTSAGTYIQVTAVQVRTAIQRVHNLTVDGIHTYYAAAGATDLLVHNADCTNVLSNTPDVDNADTLRGHDPGTAFSGVYDPTSGTFRAQLNVPLRGPNTPPNAVNRTGGHGEINFLHFRGSRDTVGFTLFKDEEGLSVGWLSRSVNGRNHGDPMAPMEHRQGIMDLVSVTTGLPVKSR